MISDPAELDLVYKAFSLACGSGKRFVRGYVEWCSERELEIARTNLAELNGLTPEGIRIDAISFVRDGGKIEQVAETRSDRSDYLYYYKIVLPIDFVRRGVFVEMRLADDDRTAPVVHLVSAHRQGV
jgi:hypothetical protein